MKIVFNPLTEQFDMVGDNDSSILIFDNYITDQTPCDLLTLSELKGRLTDESSIVFLEKAQINNSVIVKSTFAIKDYKGLYATVSHPGDSILKDFIPIPNKIFLCKADGQQYIYDGKQLRLLSACMCTVVTHSELVALRNSSQLIPGMKYRITDYTIRKDFEGTIDNISSDVKYKGQGFVFDIIVTASSNNSLYEEAQAVEHEYLEGETHNPIEFDYPKWKLKYTIDNDNPKYSWSDPLGKGVIYEMEDEYGNVCPYDFKNILFETDDNVFLTFDGLNGNYHHNIIKPWIVNGIQHLNAIILTADQCFNNVFEVNCRSIKQLTGGEYFTNNMFQNTCHTGTVGRNVKNIVISANCSNWSIGDNCYTLNIGTNNDGWTIGNNCHDITTGTLNTYWTVGQYCMYITTGNHTWQWTCEDYTSSWTAGDSCIDFTIGSGYTRIEEDLIEYESENINVTIETGAEYFLCRGLTNGVVPSSIKGALESLIELSSLYNHTLYVKKGGETPELIEISYSAFINKKRNNILIPGKQYLISDYHTFYYKDQYPNMCEVNNTLPIIVTADSKNTISPYARLGDGAIAEIRVELYDDYKFPKREAQYLYEGSLCTIEESSNVVSYNDVEYIELYLKVLDGDDKYYYSYVVKTEWEEVIAKYRYSEEPYNIQGYLANSEILASNGLFPPKGTRYDAAGEYNILKKFLSQHKYLHEIPYSRGMGEITWMKDDNGNEAPFDLKSVRWYFTEEELNDLGRVLNGEKNEFATIDANSKNNIIKTKKATVIVSGNDNVIDNDGVIWIEDCHHLNVLNVGNISLINYAEKYVRLNSNGERKIFNLADLII